MDIVDYMEIKLQPSRFPNMESREIKVTVKVYGKPEIVYVQDMFCDDTESWLDMYFDRLIGEFKAVLKKD